MTEAKNYFAWQARLVTRELGQRVVEVGCGIGNFTQFLLDRELVVSVDIEPACIARLKERYPRQDNLRAEVAYDLAPLARFHPDSCVCLNVLEHIEDDQHVLRDMASILPAGGVIVLIVPAFPVLYGPIDGNLGHYRRYTRASLGALTAATGLGVERSHYFNAIGFFGWWANAHIFRRQAQSEGQIRIFDRYLVPFLSRLEAMAQPPFGQSLFATLRKP
jgi:SAM-dependent methyltransferase